MNSTTPRFPREHRLNCICITCQDLRTEAKKAWQEKSTQIDPDGAPTPFPKAMPGVSSPASSDSTTAGTAVGAPRPSGHTPMTGPIKQELVMLLSRFNEWETYPLLYMARRTEMGRRQYGSEVKTLDWRKEKLAELTDFFWYEAEEEYEREFGRGGS